MASIYVEPSANRRVVHSAEFFDTVAACTDWGSLDRLAAAIEAKVGVPLSAPLLKLGLLSHWLELEPRELDEACQECPALSRFVASSPSTPVVDLWVFQQLAPRMQGAAGEFAQLACAIEDGLADASCLSPCSMSTEQGGSSTEGQDAWGETTLVGGDGLHPEGDPNPATELLPADPEIGAQAQSGASISTQAIIVWPWGDASYLEGMVRIGRDAAFSQYAHRLAGERRVSRRHVQLEATPTGVLIRDLGSKNGTYADSVQVPRKGSSTIASDCVVRLGSDFQFKIVFCPGPARKETRRLDATSERQQAQSKA